MSPARAMALVALALVLSIGVCSCARAPSDGASDEATVAVLGTVRALHHEADVFESAGDLDHAASAIQRILALDLPRGMLEADDVRADAWGRVAELSLRANAPDTALSQASTGIADAHRESVLRARLFMVRGEALGALADRAARTGDAPTAAARRAEALASLEQSIQINQHVLGRLTDAGHP